MGMKIDPIKNAINGAKAMLFEKMAAVLTITAIVFLLLLSSQLLFAENRSSMHFRDFPPKTHPLDLLIEDHFKKITIDGVTIELSPSDRYGGGFFYVLLQSVFLAR